MNVAFINTKNFWGGGEKLHFEYALQFRELGHRVYMITARNSPLHRRCQEAGIPVFAIRLRNLSFLNPWNYYRLATFYKKADIDTLIISNSPDLKTGGLAAYFARVPKIVYLRGLAVPIKKNPLNAFLFYKVITHLVPNSYATKRTTFSHFDSRKLEAKTKVIYHGIETEEFESPPQKPLITRQKREIILGNAGRLVEQKGQEYLIEVAGHLHNQGVDFKLYIAGTGALEEKLQRMIERKGLREKVILMGFVEDMAAFMQSIDIFLLSSLWEGFGYVIVEAMAAGKPVVAFRLSSNPEIITDTRTGYLVDFPDTEGFAAKVRALIEDAALRKSIGEEGKKSVHQRFLLGDRIREFEQYVRS